MPKDQLKRIIDTKRQVITVRGAGSGNGGGGGGGGGGDLSNYYTKTESDIRFLTPAEGDALFLTPAEGNALYVPLTSTITPGAGLVGTAALSLSAPVTLAVGAANGIEILADTVGVKLLTPGPSGLSLAPEGLSLAAHDIIGSFHEYAGAAWNVIGKNASNAPAYLPSKNDVTSDPKEALLRSNAGGTVQLAGIDIGNSAIVPKLAGEVNIYGDLNVTGTGNLPTDSPPGYGGTPLLVVNSSGGNIGILAPGPGGQPDPQFALDVGGPVRAQYFVGPHALQIKDAGLVLHFDGWQTGLEGEMTGIPLGQKPAPYGPLTFLPGKFGKALAMGEPSTNYVLNPSFEVSGSWSAGGSAQAGSGYVTDFGFVDSSSYLLIPEPSGSTTAYVLRDSLVTLAAGETAWAQVRVFRNSPWGYAAISIRANGATVATAAAPQGGATGGDEWEWLVVSYTNNSGAAQSIGVILGCRRVAGDTQAYQAWFDAVQLEVNVLTPYFDGSVPGFAGTSMPNYTNASYKCAWTGTPHASASTRTGLSRILYKMEDTGLRAASGTVCFWLNNYSPNISQNGSVFLWEAGATNAQLDLALTGAGGAALRARIKGASLQVAWNPAWNLTWKHVALTWHNGYARMYVDGVLVGGGYVTVAGDEDGFPYPATNADPIVLNSDFVISYRSTATYRLNGQIDDVVLVKRRMTGVEIKAIYESDAPVFVESSIFSFRATPKGLVWADEEGLWMKDTNGNAVFGIYGGAANKTWGDATLGQGDLLIGRGTNYVKWDADGNAGAGLLTVAGAINIVSGSGIGNLSDAGALATKSTVAIGTDTTGNLDNLADGSTYKRTTTNEKTGAGYGFTGLNSAGALKTYAVPGSALGTGARAAGLWLGSDFTGYHNGTTWKTYMDNTGKFYLSGAAGGESLTWDGSSLDIKGSIIAISGTIGGWTINSTNLAKSDGTIGLSGNPGAGATIWAGGPSSTAPFRVSYNGNVYGNDVVFTGGKVAGWRITGQDFSTGSGVGEVGMRANPAGSESSSHFTAFYAGSGTPTTSPFRVTTLGHVHTTAIVVGKSVSAAADPTVNDLSVFTYSADVATPTKRILTLYRPSSSSSGISIGDLLTGGFQITRGDSADDPVYFKQKGTGGFELYINNFRGMSLSNDGTWSVYDEGAAVLGNVTNAGAFRSNSKWGTVNVGKFLPYTSNTIAAGAGVTLGNIFGVLIVFASTSGDTALVLLRGGNAVPIIVSQTAGALFTTTAGTGGKTNIYQSSGNIFLQNGHATASYGYHLTFFGSNAA